MSVWWARAPTWRQRYCQRLGPAVAKRVGRAMQMIGVVMTIQG
jgi:hypothetical protein